MKRYVLWTLAIIGGYIAVTHARQFALVENGTAQGASSFVRSLQGRR